MIRSSRCENCGALAAPAARCRYCGAAVHVEELVAAGFGDADDSFGVMTEASGVRVTRLGVNALRVDVPPETEVGPSVVGCAWTRGTFVDLDVSVALHFEHAADGIVAGVWLRSGKSGAICVTITPAGDVFVATRRDEGRVREELGVVRAPSTFRADVPLVLRAKVVRDVLTIFRNGTAAMSVTCPTDLAGGADFVIDVPLHERGVVVFEDACARLP